jgi:drug/metabolite transporter (DMT)-like permease
VLIVLRPQNFHWAAGFALVTAFTLALFNILAKRIPKEQTVITTLMWTSLFSLPIAAILASINWQPMTWVQLGWIALSALLVLSYNGLAVIAYQRAAANQIALAEYSGLLFVVLFGVMWFDEIPDMLTWVGIGMIVLPLIPKIQLLKKRSQKKLINASN